MSTHVFGIISWFPDKQPDRKQRQERLNAFLHKINELWPTSDILIVTQNWWHWQPEPISNKIIRDDHELGLGILGARKRLREVFLQHKEYDYLIMADDDCVIQTDKHGSEAFIEELNYRKDGFMFLDYVAAQLNLCCVSQWIYEREDMVDIDAQKNEGYEDTVFSHLLHYKYSDHEIKNTANIKCIQFGMSGAPSTWSGAGNVSFNRNSNRTYFILEGFKNHDFDLKKLKRQSIANFPDPDTSNFSTSYLFETLKDSNKPDYERLYKKAKDPDIVQESISTYNMFK